MYKDRLWPSGQCVLYCGFESRQSNTEKDSILSAQSLTEIYVDQISLKQHTSGQEP